LLGQGRHGNSDNIGALRKRVFFMGVPILGGLIDSVIGIITGAVYGIAPQLVALLHSLGLPPG
jgi:hypothetical protein